MRCPRRDEVGQRANPENPDPDTWRTDDTCSYCGSLNPDLFMAQVEHETVRLGATDKSYKVYVHGLPNPEAGRLEIRASEWGGRDDAPVRYTRPTDIKDPAQLAVYEAWLKRNVRDGERGPRSVEFSPAPAERFAKFYFQHLDEGQRKRFVLLMNGKDERGMPTPKLCFEGTGFYVLPFFVVRSDSGSAASPERGGRE